LPIVDFELPTTMNQKSKIKNRQSEEIYFNFRSSASSAPLSGRTPDSFTLTQRMMPCLSTTKIARSGRPIFSLKTPYCRATAPWGQ